MSTNDKRKATAIWRDIDANNQKKRELDDANRILFKEMDELSFDVFLSSVIYRTEQRVEEYKKQIAALYKNKGEWVGAEEEYNWLMAELKQDKNYEEGQLKKYRKEKTEL